MCFVIVVSKTRQISIKIKTHELKIFLVNDKILQRYRDFGKISIYETTYVD